MKTNRKAKLIEEANELNDKIIKLKNFIENDSTFEELEEDERNDLAFQYRIMETYFNVLKKRIERMIY